jgi:hypothetical protein
MKFLLCIAIATALVGLSGYRTASVRAEDAPAAKPKDPKENFRETGRIGVLGAITEDMWKGGLIFEHEHFEAQVLAHAGFESDKTRDVHIIFKLGGRVALGTLNYFAFGGEFGPHPGSLDHGVKVGGSFQTGPYISLERYFAATPVMLTLWVNPVQYDYTLYNDGSGHAEAVKAIRIFQTGGFGIGYLF